MEVDKAVVIDVVTDVPHAPKPCASVLHVKLYLGRDLTKRIIAGADPCPAGSARSVGTKSRSDAAFCLGAGWARRGRGGGCATGGACDGDRHGLGGADDEKSDSDEIGRASGRERVGQYV